MTSSSIRHLRSFFSALGAPGFALLLLLVMTACGEPPNTQVLPIGERCSSSDECGTAPYGCNTKYPGGYCERTCAIDGDCPSDSYCIGAAKCRRKCTDDSLCRSIEGYACKANGNLGRYCDLP